MNIRSISHGLTEHHVTRGLEKVVNNIWDTSDIRLSIREVKNTLEQHVFSVLSAIPNLSRATSIHSQKTNDMKCLHNAISSFINNKCKNIEGDNYDEHRSAEFLDVCATITQFYGMPSNETRELLELHKERDWNSLSRTERGWTFLVQTEHGWAFLMEAEGSWNFLIEAESSTFSPPETRSTQLEDHNARESFLRLSWDIVSGQWNFLVPRLREQVEKIAWQIHIGQYDKWKPGGGEWQIIEKFYGGLRQRVTVTRLTVPAPLVPAPCLRKVYVATRPVDASEKNPWQYRRKETEQSDSILAAIMLAGSRYVPVSCQHWALVVERGNMFAIWELFVVEGRIKIEKSLQDSPGPSRKALVGYTTMRDDEISASAGDVRERMYERYSFSTQNCQLFCYNLFQSIRVSHTISDAFSGLDLLPNDLIFQIVMHRLGQLPGTICMDPSQVELLQPMPTFFGTLYTKALIVATTSLLIYIFINLGVVVFSLVAGVGAAWFQLAQIHINLYPWWAKKDLDQKRLVVIYNDYNPWEKNASGQFVTQSVESQQELFEQSGRIVEIDDEDQDMIGGLDEPETKRLRLTG